MYGPEVADVVIENLPDESGKLTVINEHHFTEAVGYITFSGKVLENIKVFRR